MTEGAEEVMRESENEGEGEAQLSRAMTLSDCVRHWNSFVRGLLSAVAAWERYRDMRLDESIGLEEFPLEIQKIFYKANPRGDFDFILEDIITQPNLKDYLKGLFVQIK